MVHGAVYLQLVMRFPLRSGKRSAQQTFLMVFERKPHPFESKYDVVFLQQFFSAARDAGQAAHAQ
jgi:hypothetical protein